MIGGYDGSFTDMLVQSIEAFLESKYLGFVSLEDR